MLVSPDAVAPSQTFLKPETVRYILRCIKDNELDKLPPPPIVRKDYTGRFITIDGHNLLAVKCFLGQSVEVHVASSSEDGIPVTTDADRFRNDDLREKYDSVLAERQRVVSEGVVAFTDLVEKYRPIFEEPVGS